jgi:hypothetical protein
MRRLEKIDMMRTEANMSGKRYVEERTGLISEHIPNVAQYNDTDIFPIE